MSNPTGKTILMMAGGTGGHVFPALAVADELSRRGYGIQWLGAEQGIENRLVPAAGYPLHALKVRGVRSGGLLRKLQMPFLLLRAVLAARRIVRGTSAVLAVGFGGFASGPGGLAARLAGVPLLVHEQNAVPGLTNRVLSRLAQQTLEGFEGAFASGSATAVGNPVRDSIVALAPPAQRYAERQGALRILVLGGSQGALALNRQLPAALSGLLQAQPAVIRHQAGRERTAEAASAYASVALEAAVEEFIGDMAAAYAWADLVICRAGALTVSELAAAGVPAVFVPLPTAADDHQRRNAEWLASQGAAFVVAQDQLSAGTLAACLRPVVEDGEISRPRLAAMAENARRVAQPNSATRVADICEEVLHG
ncbi:undecaprenyldiphospho-muramoylpentapeptide beta-N-acetylglucosaminyltransferase [Alcanivorax sp. JB21]|uniref:undecaprenyldiphospho-muramoylpentapeptide beta-N-acetylglucosaminyltransferase n=1 Tax=Alcanivorax limicola TaxID=2874102 RepID=UPI001CC1361E|nr:undecaprenyldiphospho-muramoylpentapeptide beta-N-acetylglucosaminyltransferase [Alcanivorax limicola]MBZ2189662.1 undecaprenyldiphospho-muramoylpentapeptide beta-N-acetylglucosaminyltransferase [Alcanivorax limicola]